MRTILLSAILAALCASPAFSHGGQFKGSGDSAGGGSAASGAATPPATPGGAAGASAGSPASGAGGLRGGASGGAGQRGRQGKGPRTGGSVDFGPSYDGWEFWWDANKDRYLNLRNRVGAQKTVSGSFGALTGRGRNGPSTSSNRPTHDDIMQKILPDLLTLMATEDDRDILDSSILALARSVPEEGESTVVEAALPMLAHNELSVQTSATISLGVLGSSDAIDVLTALMTASSAGRRHVGGGEVPQFVRAFGALGLGFIDDPRSVQPLIDIVEKLPDSERDTKVCAIVALGLMDNERIGDAFPVLIEQLDNRRLDTFIKSYIPTTLAKMAGGTMRESIGPLLDVFNDRDTDNAVRQSVAIGLGRLATMDDTEVIDALSDYATGGRDVQTRHYAFISLGKIGARDDAPEQRRDAHDALVRLLANETTKPSTKSNAPWAAIASALYARGEAHRDAHPEIIDRLWWAYGDTKNASYRAAYVIALGLMDSREHAGALHTDFLESKDNDFRGYAAVALGLMGHEKAKLDFRGMVQNATVAPTFRLQLATSLGLLADGGAIEVLVNTLETAQTLGVSSAVAKALGLIGDASALAPLLAVANDDRKPTITRAFAAVGLGIVGERGDLPFNARISEDNNYRARVPAIDEILDIL